MSDLTQNQERAAFHGVAMNKAYATPVRIQAALQALEMYEAEVELLRNEIKGLRNDEDFDPSPVITEYDRVVEENAHLVARMRRLAAQLSVGWDMEEHPDVQYLAYAQAFKEAARRILEEVEQEVRVDHLPPQGDLGTLRPEGGHIDEFRS